MSYKKVFTTILFLLLLGLFPSNTSFPQAKEQINASPCIFSKEYLDWLELSKEEQEIIPMPTICKTYEKQTNYYNYQNLFDALASSTYPSKYDSRNVNGSNYVSAVRNQQSTGSCWAFSALSTIESYLIKFQNSYYTLSPRHLEYSTSRYFLNGVTNPESYNRTVGQGGNGYMASNYFINGKGPISESSMPFENNENLIDYSAIQNKTQLVDVKGYEIIDNSSGGCTTSIKNQIKQHIIDYGTMSTNIYMTTSSEYYRQNTASLFYQYTLNNVKAPNHAVTIVGWDDDYSRYNFSSSNQPTSNGAWIIKNSYGTNWSYGKNGYFYISYEDSWVCANPTGATNVDLTTEDNTYYHDVLGFNSFYGYSSTSAYAANIFTLKGEQELLREVTIATKANTNYTVYINPLDESLDKEKLIYVGEGSATYSGYHTLDLKNPLILENEKFAVVVHYQLTSGTHPIGTQIKSGTLFDKGNYTTGLSYVSSSLDGPWEDLATDTNYRPFASIKAGTDEIDYNFTVGNPTSAPAQPYATAPFTITVPISLTNINLNNLNVKIYNGVDNDVTNSFTITKNTTNIQISNGTSNIKDNYRIELSYAEVIREVKFELFNQYELFVGEITTESTMYDINENTINIPITTVGYANGYNLSVKVSSSSDEDVTNSLTISNLAVTNNQANITIRIPANTNPDTYNVTISGLGYQAYASFIIIEYVKVTGMTVSPSTMYTLKVGRTQKFTTTFTPSNATNKRAIFETEDQTIAEVDENGIVTAISRGSTYLHITSEDNPSITKKVRLTVVDPKVTIDTYFIKGSNPIDTSALFNGSEGTITLTVTSQDLTELNVSVVSSSGSASSYFTINKGTITNNKSTITITSPGTAPVGTYSINISGSNANTVSFQFKINSAALISSISISDIRTYTGINYLITPTITPSDAYNQRLKYTVADESIATIQDGLLTTLKEGKTIITAEATDGSNIKTTFTLHVIDDLFIDTDYQETEGYVFNIEEKTSYASFYNSLNIRPGNSVKIYNSSKTTQITSGYISTGMILEDISPTKTTTYILIVKGDTSGDGTIGSNDALLIRRHVVKLSTLQVANQKAADVDGDGSISSIDALRIRRYVVKLGTL